ncbi:MAG: site-specific integrase [Sulfuricaulis sp.]|nr:site-specific integrase [Sulfuricaulis sp.]
MATIRAKGNGWEAMVRRKGHLPISKSFPKRVLAERWARELEAQIDAGRYRDTRLAEKTPLSSLLTRYEQEITPHREPSSHVPEKSRLKTLKGFFGDYMAAGTSSEHVVHYVRHRLASVSSDAVRKELQLLSDLFDCARAMWGLPAVNPVPDARRIVRKLRLLEPINRRTRRLRPGEYEKIRKARHRQVTVINQLALFAIETGLRRGELVCARLEYVHHDTLDVPRSKTDWITGRRGRVVPLSGLARAIAKSLPKRKDGLLFGLQPRSMTQAFARLCAGAKIEDLHLHDLRHEAISRWFEMGFSIPEVATMSGHADWRSLKIYTQIDPRRLAARLGG